MKKILLLVVILWVLVLGCAHVSESELKAVHHAKDQYGNCYFYLIDKTGQPGRLGVFVTDGDVGKCPPVIEGRKFLSVELRKGQGAQEIIIGGNQPESSECYAVYGESFLTVAGAGNSKFWRLKRCPQFEKRF